MTSAEFLVKLTLNTSPAAAGQRITLARGRRVSLRSAMDA